MKTNAQMFRIVCTPAFFTASLLGLSLTTLVGADLRSSNSSNTSTVTADTTAADDGAALAERQKDHDLLIRVLEPDPLHGQSRRPLPWLGLATEETSEALTDFSDCGATGHEAS